MDAYAPQMAGNNYAQFIVNTQSDKATLDLLAQYQPLLSEAFPNAYVKFKRLDYLEVSELEYRFYGDNLDSLHVVAERLMERMRQMPELEWVHTDYLQPYPIINVELDPVTSAQLGITRTTAQLALSATSSDLRVGQIWEDNYELPIVVKDDTDMTFSDVANLGIASPASLVSGGLHSTNSTVPLRQIAKVAPKWSESRIMHRGGERCITVTAQFAQGVYTAPIEKEIARIMQEEILLPQGVRTEVAADYRWYYHCDDYRVLLPVIQFQEVWRDYCLYGCLGSDDSRCTHRSGTDEPRLRTDLYLRTHHPDGNDYA